MADPDFPPTLAAARARIAAVRPADYACSRNALDGAVTHLSPYLSHGLISLPEVLAGVADRHAPGLHHRFVLELGWRDYFRHRWLLQGEAILDDLHAGPLPREAYASQLPEDIRSGRTGLPVIDQAVSTLYRSGYLHNHARMWLASYVVHLRKVHWRAGADWMLAHLLDGDLASNHLSWQWVAGTASHKPYLFNADNVARYAPPDWHSPGTVIDTSYEGLEAVARNGAAVGAPDRAPTAQAAAGVDEPPPACPPPGATPPDPAWVAGRDVWLIHPWALGEPPVDLPPGHRRLAWWPAELLATWPWTRRRQQFVLGRLADLDAPLWLADGPGLDQALRAANSVQTLEDPHVRPWLPAQVQARPAPTLFGPPTPADARSVSPSFSHWWSRRTRGLHSVADLPGLRHWVQAQRQAQAQGFSAGPLFDGSP